MVGVSTDGGRGCALSSGDGDTDRWQGTHSCGCMHMLYECVCVFKTAF